MRTTEYQVNWISPRGFANEGDYVYGVTSEVEEDAITAERDDFISNHRSLTTARKAAINAARKARREYTENDTISIGIREAGKEPTQEDWEAVKYGK
jgi:hypothetical protein